MIKNIIVFGPPGSGKGTQARILAKKLGFFYFGTGDLMREETEKGTPLGKKFQAVWDRGQGELIDEDLVNELVKSRLVRIPAQKGIVFDGYPRTLNQAEVLSPYLENRTGKTIVLNLKVNQESLVGRMQTRRVCANCDKVFFRPERSGIVECDNCQGKLIQRQEDTEEVIKKRFGVYEHMTEPVLGYYQDKGELININGEPPIEEVTREIDEVLKTANEN